MMQKLADRFEPNKFIEFNSQKQKKHSISCSSYEKRFIAEMGCFGFSMKI